MAKTYRQRVLECYPYAYLSYGHIVMHVQDSTGLWRKRVLTNYHYNSTESWKEALKMVQEDILRKLEE